MEPSSDSAAPQGRPGRINLFILGFVLIATLVAGIAIGLLINRPVVVEPAQMAVPLKSEGQTVAQAGQPPAQAALQNPSATTTEAEGESSAALPTPTIMDFVLSDARHFRGSPDAPVTIVEFSDFK